MPHDIRHLLPVTATVQRLSRVPIGHGEWRDVFVTAGALPCRISEPELIQRSDQQGRLRADMVRTLYTLAGEDIQTGDRVTVATLGITANVEGAADQNDGAYRKALIVEE